MNQLSTLQKLDGADVKNHITCVRGDNATLRFSFPEVSNQKSKQKVRNSVVQVPHGKLRYRPPQGYEEKRAEIDKEYDSDQSFDTDVTE